jgi:hypothetical protein
MKSTVRMAIKKLKWKWFDHRTDVPQWIASGIGRVAIEWSVLEREMEELIQLLFDSHIQTTRILVNKMNVRTRLFIATTLLEAQVYSSAAPAARLKEINKLGQRIAATQTKRDLLDKRKNEWHVLRLRQSRPTPQLEPDLKKLSRAIVPQTEKIDRTKLRAIAKEIVAIANEVQTFRESLATALAPSRYTRQKYSRRRYDYH